LAFLAHKSYAVLFAAALAGGCRSGTRPDVNDGGIAFACQREDCTPDPNGVCQHTCTPDPGPRLVDCGKAETGFDFSTPFIWTFEEPDPMRRARAMYSYTDNTNSIATFKEPATDAGPGGARQTYQPPTAVMPRCSDRPNPNNRAIHVQGGPFFAWGGGIGIAMKDHPSRGSFPAAPGPDAVSGAAIDASQWEGISFWARRGPDSQVGFRVLAGDKYTDDDIAYRLYRDYGNDPTVERYCERVRECACLNHQACAPLDVVTNAGGRVTSPADFPQVCVNPHQNPPPPATVPMSFCGPPAILSAGSMGAGAGSSTQCNTCEVTRCNENYPAYPDDFPAPGGTQPTDPNTGAPVAGLPAGVDRQFYGKPCTTYTMRNGITSAWCFDPAANERPAEQSEQCGDHWTSVVNLSNEWQFYTVPFDRMLQQGWAKRSPRLDLTSLAVVRFTWDGGWVDYWIDDVTFYRHKTQQ